MASRDMLINSIRGEECRIAVVEDGKLQELYTERTSADLHVGNIYRGVVTNIEPAIQAAFVDFGLKRSGFLHITDLHPRYFRGQDHEATERVGHKTPRRERPPIQQCLRRGQEILVQVLKEGIGTKGPTLTSYLSIPGRYLVMMPNMENHGVSRKIEDVEKRRRMHEILDDLKPPEGFGFIVRTAGMEQNKTELKRDLNYLLRLWKDIDRRMTLGKGPAELFVESDLIIRTMRDVMTADVKRIIVDDRGSALSVKQFMRLSMPRSSVKVYHYRQTVPLFDAFDIERQIQSIHERKVPLPSGGSLIFDQAEAMVAIDVNSGKSRDSGDSETNAYHTNLEAVEELTRQLRLRDLGGIIVIDLIDMYQLRHRKEVEKRVKTLMKEDRARTKVLGISELGILEMTRQRMRPSLKRSVYDLCATCHGTGHVMSAESVALEIMRRLAVVLHMERVQRIDLSAHPNVLALLLNRRRLPLLKLEKETGKSVNFKINADPGPDRVTLAAFDSHGVAIDLEQIKPAPKPQLASEQEVTNEDLGDMGQVEDFEEELLAEAEEEAAAPSLPAAMMPSTEAAPAEQKAPADDHHETAVPDQAQSGGDRRPQRQSQSHRHTGHGQQHLPQHPHQHPHQGQSGQDQEGQEGGGRRRRRRRGRRGRGGGGQGGQGGGPAGAPGNPNPPHSVAAPHSGHNAPHHAPVAPPVDRGGPPPAAPAPVNVSSNYEPGDGVPVATIDADAGPQPGNLIGNSQGAPQQGQGGPEGQGGGGRRRRRRRGRRGRGRGRSGQSGNGGQSGGDSGGNTGGGSDQPS